MKEQAFTIGEPLRQALWGKNYKEREARSEYLRELIAEQQADPRANARN
jgi:hypothetical protein